MLKIWATITTRIIFSKSLSKCLLLSLIAITCSNYFLLSRIENILQNKREFLQWRKKLNCGLKRMSFCLNITLRESKIILVKSEIKYDFKYLFAIYFR
jgi:hypothetical protein